MLLTADDAQPDLRLCKLNFYVVVVISDMQSLKKSLILEYEIPYISWPDFVLNMRYIHELFLSLEISNWTFCKYTSKYLTGQHSDFILEM